MIFLCGIASIAHAADRPNVLLIMSDDLRDFGGAFRREVVKTPNLDRLRARDTDRHGAFWNVWMRSLEYQVQEENLGDRYLLAGTEADLPTSPKLENVPGAPNLRWDPTQPFKPTKGAEVYYRNIRIRPITTFPAKLLADSKLTPTQ